MNIEYLKIKHKEKELTSEELIDQLRDQLKEARIQRNDYQQDLIKASKIINKLKEENQYYESYINRTKK